MVLILLDPVLAGCLNLPAPPPRTTEDFSIRVVSVEPSTSYVLYLPALLHGGAPAPPVLLLNSSSPEVESSLAVRDNLSVIRVAGRGNATLTSHRELGRSGDFEGYSWSTASPPGLGFSPDPAILVLRENLTGSTQNVHIEIEFEGERVDGSDYAHREARFAMDVPLSDAWQRFEGSDGLAVS